MNTEEKYMRRCIQLAQNGLCNAAPNPMVGAVIVCDGKIIGEGYHIRCGEAHAEVNAIRSVKEPALLKKSTIYVSLEPCSHYGKTPPCADLIIEKQIPRIVHRLPGPLLQGSRPRHTKVERRRPGSHCRSIGGRMQVTYPQIHHFPHIATSLHYPKMGGISRQIHRPQPHQRKPGSAVQPTHSHVGTQETGGTQGHYGRHTYRLAGQSQPKHTPLVRKVSRTHCPGQKAVSAGLPPSV